MKENKWAKEIRESSGPANPMTIVNSPVSTGVKGDKAKPVTLRAIRPNEAGLGAESKPSPAPDLSKYWVSEEDYYNRQRFGGFTEGGRAYEIFDRHPPRPWLNFLSNNLVGSVVSNDGLGFIFYKTTLLRVTRYDAPAGEPYREFNDGRKVFLRDSETGREWDVFREAAGLKCVHRPGSTTLAASLDGLELELKVFVPVEDPAECWSLHLKNTGPRRRKLEMRVEQAWTFANFDSYAQAENPYCPEPGKNGKVLLENGAVVAYSTPRGLTFPLLGLFSSPHLNHSFFSEESSVDGLGRAFSYKKCRLSGEFVLEPNAGREVSVVSAVEEEEVAFRRLKNRYAQPETFHAEWEKVARRWEQLIQYPSCEIPEQNLQNFLNGWLKNQLSLNSRFTQSGFIRCGEALQVHWGNTLVEPEKAHEGLLQTIAHTNLDGSCPEFYSPIDSRRDNRKSTEMGLWLPLALSDYIKETGNLAILDEKIPYVEPLSLGSVGEHAWKVLDFLHHNRGKHGLCLAEKEDELARMEQGRRNGETESVWRTMALFHAQNLMAELYRYDEDEAKAEILKDRSADLKRIIQKRAWDGDWYIHGYDKNNKPIGSKKSAEGKIHLKPQSWALITGLATENQIRKIRKAVQEHLETKLGIATLAPPYADLKAETGEMFWGEAGTGENGSIHLQTAALDILADYQCGYLEKAYRKLLKILPTNPENPDCRRTGEPYCLGDYYCGPNHPRFGQNFFSWFNPNAAWLLRIGFDQLFGIKADFNGLHIAPNVPFAWDRFSVKRPYRGTLYHLHFQRTKSWGKYMMVDGKKINGRFLKPQTEKEVVVQVFY